MESSLIQICEHNVSITVYTIKDKSLKLLSFMERETRLELATSSLARRHSTTELPPHRVLFYYYMNKIFLQAFFLFIQQQALLLLFGCPLSVFQLLICQETVFLGCLQVHWNFLPRTWKLPVLLHHNQSL